jgi:hypothetical protein
VFLIERARFPRSEAAVWTRLMFAYLKLRGAGADSRYVQARLHNGFLLPGQAPREERRPGDCILELAFATFTELDLVLVRLMGREPELHSAADRLRSEGELRQALVLPVATLGVVLAVLGTVAAPIVVVVASAGVAALVAQAERRRTEANELLADALSLERVHAPTLERFLRLNGIDWSDRPASGEAGPAGARALPRAWRDRG